MIDGLIMSDNNNSYVAVAAKARSPTVENGGIVTKDDGTIEMTWHLQEGVTWQDGEPFYQRRRLFYADFIQSEAGAAVYNQTDYMGIVDRQMPIRTPSSSCGTNPSPPTPHSSTPFCPSTFWKARTS